MSRLEKFGMPKDDRFKREKFRKLRQDARRLAAERAQWLWFGAALLAITVIAWVVILP
jgi:hypothetical protein